MDRRAARRRIEIGAVLDLHGLDQIAAEDRLRRFIMLARHQRSRCVLVITGKGASGGARGGARTDPDQPFDMTRPVRGILRMRFLDWVEQSPLRDQIIRVAPAKARDGGRGAFYIFLKS